MIRPGGYAVWSAPTGVREKDTFSCCHCNKVVFVEPRQSATDAGGWCMRCARNTCGPCADLGRCTPLEKRIEQMEARGRLLKEVCG